MLIYFKFHQEVETALNQMVLLKYPNLNGYNAGFYQAYWHIVGSKINNVVFKFFNEDIFDNCINQSHIELNLKIKNHVKISDFRPIDLCNVIYKLVSKVLTNRLKRILPDIISKSQSTFNPKKLIIDNVIVGK